MRAYLMLSENYGRPAGTVVYDVVVNDFGMANNDSLAAKRVYKAVSLIPSGRHPIITVPVEDLKLVAEVNKEETNCCQRGCVCK